VRILSARSVRSRRSSITISQGRSLVSRWQDWRIGESWMPNYVSMSMHYTVPIYSIYLYGYIQYTEWFTEQALPSPQLFLLWVMYLLKFWFLEFLSNNCLYSRAKDNIFKFIDFSIPYLRSFMWQYRLIFQNKTTFPAQ